MKILIITEYYGNQINGIAIRINNYVKYLKKFGHIVHVFGPENSNADYILPTIKNIFYEDNYFTLPNIELIKSIITEKYDTIHIVSPPQICSLLVLPISKNFTKNIVVSNHVSPKCIDNYFENNIFRTIMSNIIRTTVFEPQNIYANKILSPTIYPELLEYLPNVEIIPTGIDYTIFNGNNISKKKSRNKKLIYVGRLAKEKNCYKMLDLFNLLDDYTLDIIGDGPEKDNLLNYVKKNNIKNINFLGYIENNKLGIIIKNIKHL